MNEAWMDEFDLEFFDSEDEVSEEQDWIDENIHKVLSERLNACDDIKKFIAQKLEEARKEARDGVLHTTAETIEMVIGTIALDQGWEETGDKYRKMYGLPMIYVK